MSTKKADHIHIWISTQRETEEDITFIASFNAKKQHSFASFIY